MTARTIPRPHAAALAAPLLWLAAPAHAAEGSLDIAPDFGELALLLVLFLLLIAPAHKLLFKPLLATLDARDARIRGARERAAEVSARGDAVMERYQRAVRKARVEADQLREALLADARSAQAAVRADARAAAEQQRAQARREIDTASQRARDELQAESAAIAKLVATQLLGRPLS